jgi:hypothetical protein
MATVDKLTKKDRIAGEATQANIDKWAARASRNSVQFSVNKPGQNNRMSLDDTADAPDEDVRTFVQCKYGGGSRGKG